MPHTSFEFAAVAPLRDGELELLLTECQPADANAWRVPAYHFRMQSVGGAYAGRIRLRIGWNDDIIQYAGQVGYVVEPEFRGRHFAERACRLIVPVAQHHGLQHLWITCQPDNLASRRTLERLGADSVGTLEVPDHYPLDAGHERRKLCFRWAIGKPAPG